MEVKLGGMNAHKIMKFMKAQFPGKIYNIVDYDPLYIGDAIADGMYYSNIGDVEVRGGHIYENNKAVTTMTVGTADPTRRFNAAGYNFFRILTIDGHHMLLHNRDFDQLIKILELRPI